MVNYVLSFCKITGASKIFTRNFYLPLLKPLTPKDALRTLRITGKWLLGAKIQHYIPVLLNHKKKCTDLNVYCKEKHKIMDDHVYMTPVYDIENEDHKVLLKMLESKDASGVFVYTVEDKKYNIVFQAQFEMAIRDGDILDVLVSQKNDKIVVKLKNFKKISMEIQYFEGTGEIFCGKGATSPEEEKFHHHGKYTMSLAKIFEEKELREEKWEEELKKILKKRKKFKWENSKAYKEMMKKNMKSLNWKKFEEDAKKVIEEIAEPATEQPIEMEVEDLETTKNVNQTILRGGPELLNQLPTITEIPDIIKYLGGASLHNIEEVEHCTESDILNKKICVSGVKVTLPSGKQCFISGQMVHTEEGEIFIPGQTIENEFGDEYAPGITINIDNKPTLLSGLIMGEEQQDPIFLPSHSTITADGQLTFASVPEERPSPQPENKRKFNRKYNKSSNQIKQQNEMLLVNENLVNEIQDELLITRCLESLIEPDDKSSGESCSELTSSELEEINMEMIRIKQDKQRAELKDLKLLLLDDGMNDIIASLEDKKEQLRKKLEELRKLNVNAENNFITYVNESDAWQVASKISKDKETIIRVSDILLTMTRRAATFRDKNNLLGSNVNNSCVRINATEVETKFNICSNKLKILFKSALIASNDVFKNRPKDQVLALNAIGEILVDPLKTDEKLLREFINTMNTHFERNDMCTAAFKQLTYIVEDTKLAVLNVMVKGDSLSDISEYISKILDSENIMKTSFYKLAKVNPEVYELLRENLVGQLQNINTDNDAVNILQKSIVKVTKSLLDKNLEKLKEERNDTIAKELIHEAASFAKALDLKEIADNLMKLEIPLKHNYLSAEISEMVKRMILMRSLAEREYSLKTAITRIKKNPDCAKSDPRIHQLIRESAVLISNLSILRNSRDIPLQLMKSQNILAIEDFLLRKSIFNCPVLITRGTSQAIIPKDTARGVLAGRVPYILIDESGVTNYKPMHMMSVVQVNRNRERRIGNYLNGVRERSSDKEDTRTFLQAKANVKRLDKLFNNHREVA